MAAIAMYVDDLIITSKLREKLEAMKQKLNQVSGMEVMGRPVFFFEEGGGNGYKNHQGQK